VIKTANLTASVSRNAGGLFESVRRLVQSLAATGMDVRVLGTRDEFTDADIAAWAPVKVSAFAPVWPEKFGYSPGFVSAMSEFAPDITHTHGIWLYPSVATNHYARKSKSQYLISAHGMLDPWAVRNSRWKKAIAYFFYEGSHLRRARCLRALCEPEARAIRQLGLTNDIVIIPNGIDIPERAGSADRRAENGLSTRNSVLPGSVTQISRWPSARTAVSQNSILPSCPNTETVRSPDPTSPPASRFPFPASRLLLYLGRIHPKKGLVNLLRAWAVVQKEERRAKSEEWVLAIAGWDQGGHEAELKRLATELGIGFEEGRAESGERVSEGARSHSSLSTLHSSLVFLGPRFDDDKTACYRACDGFILPSFSEGVPMVVLEAWANAKPVLMTPECNLPEGFTRNAAIKINPNPESIADGLRQFMRLRDTERQTIADNGFALAKERFAWPRIAQDMRQVYEWMLGGGPRPGTVADF
jgi:glycosyltransferase involved in cell wall biosynthesis